jgi:hypothetical protein
MARQGITSVIALHVDPPADQGSVSSGDAR